MPSPLTMPRSAKCPIPGRSPNWPAAPPMPGSPTPVAPPLNVAAMPLQDRFCEVLTRTLPLLPKDIRQEFAALISPLNIVIIAVALVAWAGSHYLGVGFILDGLMVVGGVVFLGIQVLSAASDFYYAITITANATTPAELQKAAEHLSKFVSAVGVAVFSALVMRGAKAAAPKARAAIAGAAATRYAGMTPSHYRAFQYIAHMHDRIIAVRNTNVLSTRWIELGYPSKPVFLKVHTSKTTGIVTATNDADVRLARDIGYYVVDADGIARNAAGLELKFAKTPEWPLETGQVIHHSQHKPIVGDYDLLGVIDPHAPANNSVVTHAANGLSLLNRTNAEVRRIVDALNAAMGGQPRVMHGAYDGFADVSTAGPVTFFFPEGVVLEMTAQEAAAFYQAIGRVAVIK